MTMIFKEAAGKISGSRTYVLSDATVDRMGDIIEPAGWQLGWFTKNPIALFGHNSAFPIGTWENVRVESSKLMAEFAPAAAGTSARIDEIVRLIDQGILRATSVGFMPLEFEPLDKDKPFAGQRYTKQQLLETSIVSVPANPAALQLAKSIHISNETMSLVFGEHADTRQRDMATTGEHAETKNATSRPPVGSQSRPKVQYTMKTLSQRIEDTQFDVVAKRDKLSELTSAENLDVEAVEELNVQLETAERNLAALKLSEAKIGTGAMREASRDSGTVPAVARRPLGVQQKQVGGFDLLVRAATVRGLAHFTGRTIDSVLEERYPGHDATWIIAKADQTIGTTTVSGWAAELVQTVNQGFMNALQPFSIYPDLRARGIGVSFDGIGTVSLPSRTAGGAGGGFVAEGAPIRVGRITTAAVTMTPKKLGVIVPFSRELAKHSTPAIEAVVRNAILEDSGNILDAAIIDAAAASTARPAGLLNGVAAVGVGAAGADSLAVIADLKALLAPFYAANAGDNITVLMNPSQGLSLALMPGPGTAGTFGWSAAITNRLHIIESTNVPAGRLIALRNSDFATATGDTPEFEVSDTATVHMEDTTPLEIVSGTPTVADPVRSFFQTATVGVRMLWDVSWRMRRTGMVSWVNGTTW